MKNFKTKSQALSNASSSRRNEINQFKVYEKCLDYVQVKPFYRFFIALFYLIIIVAQILIIYQATYLTSSYSEIKTRGDIVISAYTRADNTDLTNWAVRLLNVAVKGNYGPDGATIYPEFLGWLKTNSESMKQSNYLLESQVSSIGADLQTEFYKKGVKMYEFNDTGPTGKY
jgi:hypothetical protein